MTNTTTTTNNTNTPLTTQEVNTLFKFKRDAVLDASNIRIDNIEHSAGNNVAGAILGALKEQGKVTQYFDKEIDPRNYLYDAAFDIKLVALMGVQLCKPLVWCHRWLDMDMVAETTVVWKHFRTVARANQSIMNCFDPAKDKKAYWVVQTKRALELAVDANLLDLNEDGHIMRSDKFLGLCISRASIAPVTSKLTLDTRRKERVKTRFNPKKDGTSAAVREAFTFIEDQAQAVNTWLLDAIEEVRTWYVSNNYILPEVFKDGAHVIDGCAAMRDYEELYTEYFADLRGRMYQFAHYGPNPQGADMAKALCYHTVVEEVMIGSAGYDIFMNEFNTEVLPSMDSDWASEARIRRVAAAPAEALKYALTSHTMFKKFFTYMDMCRTWVDFKDHGKAVTRLGFGPDAKTSGAQILSILAGAEDKAAACGLTMSPVREKDLYEQSAEEVAALVDKYPQYGSIAALTRGDIKTPFMAIQYGGGVPSLRYKKFEPVLERIGVPQVKRDAFCSDIVVGGIMNALGGKITGLIDSVRKAVADKLEDEGKTWFAYRHIDGFQCTKKGEASVKLTQSHFFISLGDGGKGVIFGATPEAKGGQQGWKIQSTEQGELQATNFAYYFIVHYVQGLDAVMARKIALEAKRQGVRGYSTIHDQFRACLSDAHLMKGVCANVYKDMFIDNDPLQHLMDQTGMRLHAGNPLTPIHKFITEEMLESEHSFYFE